MLVPIHFVRDRSAVMSGTKSSFNISRNTAERRQQQKIHKGRVLTQIYPLSSSVIPSAPSTGPGVWECPKLPLLTNMAHQRMPGFTELALLIPDQRTLCETFSHKFSPSLRTHISLPSCESTDRLLGTCRPVYTHFSLPLRPLPRLNHVARPARRLNISQCVLQPFTKDQQSPGCQENLSIKGVPCFSRVLPTKGPKQLHVFLPTEGTKEEDDKDSESVDEGFMDEVDHKAVFKQTDGETKTE